MELAIEGTSGTDAARRLGLPRQMVNYHVLALERAGFLVRIGEVRRRNMVERRVRASARSYVISPDVLGPLSAARRRAPDPASAAGLLSLTAKVQSDLRSSPPGSSVLSLSTKIRFATEDLRQSFTRSIGDAVVQVIRAFTRSGTITEREGTPYGLILGLYPLPRPASSTQEGDHR